jgi:large repetitive protein
MRACFKAIDSWLEKANGFMFGQPRQSNTPSLAKNWLAFVYALIATLACQPTLAGTTGAWTTAAAPSATANGITLTATGSSALTPAAGTLYATPYWSNPYGASVAGGTSLNYVVNPGGTSMTVVFTFSKAVSNPVLHIQRLGGQAGTLNSSSWQLTGSNLGTTPTMSRLSGNFQFQLNGANTTFFRPAGGTFVSAACTSAAGSTSDDGGTACGSVRVNGTGITSLTFTVSMIGGPGSGDGLDLAWSVPNENIVVKKQSIGATGSFSFSGTNGVSSISLNTASSNPVASAAATITNLTLPISVTEAPTAGFALTGASCVDQSAAVVASSLSGGTLTIASNAYSDNGTITCSFINQALPILGVTKSAPSPALAFGINSTYSLTATNSGSAAATTAQIKDQLPAGLSFVSATGPNWACANASGLITCNFAGASIGASGGTSVISVVATPIATVGSTNVTNYASIDPSGGAAAPVPGAGCTPAASCASNTSPVAAYINAVAETGSSVSGTAATPIANVTSNDTINGTPATLGALGNATVAQSGTWPAGVTLNATTGAISVAATVQPGNYSFSYQLCDKSTPVNCKTALDTLTVAANIAPTAESGSAVSGVASTPIPNVTLNDNLNGAPATLGPSGNAVVSQSGTWPVGLSLNPATGAISTTSAVAPGTYNVTYQVCDKNTPVNCATSTVTITVAANIAPVADTGTAAAGIASVAVANVGANDSVNGAPAILSGPSTNATIGVVGSWPAGVTLNAATGAISTTVSTPPGTYTVPYRLCDTNVPVNCATASATFTVSAAILPLPDNGNGVSGVASTVVTNITSNDLVNGSAATLAGASFNATVSQSGVWPSGINLNPLTGNVAIGASVQPGVYVVTYQLCDRNSPVNCATNINTVTVAAAIAPNADTGSATSGTPSTPVTNVTANDTLNGFPATLGALGNATIATVGTWPAGITLNPLTGAVSSAAIVQPGTYDLQYQLCDKNTPVNCQTQSVRIIVAALIVPTRDAGTAPSGTASTPITNVVGNDSVNGLGPTLGPLGNATVAQSGSWPVGITLNPATGAIATTEDVQPGTYVVAYQLCDKNLPVNCVTANATVTVVGTIIPTTDSGSAIAGAPSTPITNLAINDVVNGDPATLGPSGNATVSQSGTWPTGITLDLLTGAVSTNATVQPGTYTLTYQLCDKSVPVFCGLTTLTINVAADIAPVADTGPSISGTSTTVIANVAGNDSVNGNPATLGLGGNATLLQLSSSNPGVALNPLTGAVTVAASVQPGSYAVDYRICDRNSPPNCANTTAVVRVRADIDPVTESGLAVSGAASTPIANVAANDSVNGFSATLGTSGNATVAISGTWPLGVSLNTMTGAISTSSGVPPGTYNLTYRLCDKSTPANCATQTITITIAAAITPIADIGRGQAGVASTAIVNIAANDTVNGRVAQVGSGGNATVAQSGLWPTGIALDSLTGAVLIGADAPVGIHIVSYQLCDKNTPANCALQTVTLTIAANLAPVADTGTAIAGMTSTPIADIAANDNVNGTPATLGLTGNATVAISGSWPAGLILNPVTGAVTSSAGLQPGTYSLTYALCDRATPVNCQTQTLTITVAGNIVPVGDSGTANAGQASVAIANIAANDAVNGVSAVLGSGGNAVVSQIGVWPSGLTLDPNTGTVATTGALSAGTYVVSYQLCDRSTPANCQSQTITIVVTETKGSITGSVYTDTNVDRQRQGNEPPRTNWIVELVSNGQVIATARTDANGNYRFDNVLQSTAYEIRFVNPENRVVFGRIMGVAVTAGATVVDQNQAIDPAGVIFDSVTRRPVSGAVVTAVDARGITLPTSCFMDASQRSQTTGPSGEYRFDLVPGGAAQCPRGEAVYRILVTPPAGYSAESTVILPQVGPFDPTGLSAPVRISPLPTPALTGEVPYYLSFRLAAGDPDIVFNHIPLDPFLTRTALVITKSSPLRSASVGDLVPYEITVRNTEAVRRSGVSIIDVLPAGMKFVSGSATVDGNASQPVLGERDISWLGQTIPANATLRFRLVLVVGAGVSGGEKVNTGLAMNPATGEVISNRGTAAISIVPSAVFDCSDVIGKVFEDANHNGYQDESEQGVAGVRLATVNGQLVTTDAFGRYHITCAGVPDARIGSNFVLKVDTRTLPLGWAVTTDNPRSIRLTRGKFGELNFGVAPIPATQSDAPRKAEGE